MASKSNKKKIDKTKAKIIKNLRQKIYYRKSKISNLNSTRKKGYKSKRTLLYDELIKLKKQVRSLTRDYSDRRKRKGKKTMKATALGSGSGIFEYTEGVWQFENKLRDYIRNKTFKKIYIANVGKVFYVSSTRPSTILYNYDVSRNEAYFGKTANTPLVDVREDYSNGGILSIHIQS